MTDLNSKCSDGYAQSKPLPFCIFLSSRETGGIQSCQGRNILLLDLHMDWVDVIPMGRAPILGCFPAQRVLPVQPLGPSLSAGHTAVGCSPGSPSNVFALSYL